MSVRVFTDLRYDVVGRITSWFSRDIHSVRLMSSHTGLLKLPLQCTQPFSNQVNILHKQRRPMIASIRTSYMRMYAI